MNFSVASSNSGQNSKSRLDQLLQIQQSGGSPAERRALLRALQQEMEGERVNQLMVSIPKVKAEPATQEDKEETNEDGDIVQISQAAQQQYENSESSASTESASSSSASTSSGSSESSS